MKLSDDTHRSIDTLCKIVTAMAIVVAGYWTYHKFVREEEPTLEIRARTSSRITWDSIDNDSCAALFDVKLENIGTTMFAVHQIDVSGWLVQRKLVGAEETRWFDAQTLERTPPFFTKSLTSGSFIAKFPPGTWDKDTFEWWIRRPADESRLVYFRIAFLDEHNQVMAFETDWDAICGAGSGGVRQRDGLNNQPAAADAPARAPVRPTTRP
jgi:hypothetical protein